MRSRAAPAGLYDVLLTLAAAAVFCALAIVPGCLCGGGFDRCEEDRFACQDGTEVFALNAECTLSDDLEVELGHGHKQYGSLGLGELPPLTHGPQGGSHVFLGLRVLNAALDRYDKLKVTLSAWLISPTLCDSNWGEPWPADAPTGCAHEEEHRELVLGHHHPVTVAADGAVEEFGIFFRLDEPYGPGGYQLALRLQVEDPCGRTGEAEHLVPVSEFKKQ